MTLTTTTTKITTMATTTITIKTFTSGSYFCCFSITCVPTIFLSHNIQLLIFPPRLRIRSQPQRLQLISGGNFLAPAHSGSHPFRLKHFLFLFSTIPVLHTFVLLSIRIFTIWYICPHTQLQLCFGLPLCHFYCVWHPRLPLPMSTDCKAGYGLNCKPSHPAFKQPAPIISFWTLA